MRTTHSVLGGSGLGCLIKGLEMATPHVGVRGSATHHTDPGATPHVGVRESATHHTDPGAHVARSRSAVAKVKKTFGESAGWGGREGGRK